MIDKSKLREFYLQSQKVYNSLMDEQSKHIFALRSLYNLTLDSKYLLNMVSIIPDFDSKEIKKFIDFYKQCRNIMDQYPSKKLIIYGAGRWGKYLFDLLQMFSHINVYCFCDKDPQKQESTYCGLPVISPDKLINMHMEDFVIIGTRDYESEVKNQLISMGFPAGHILSGIIKYEFDILFEKQYFEAPIIQPQDKEVFVDAGCFNCDTSILFKKWCDGKYEKIYAFEPDGINYLKCKEVIKQENIENIELFNAGLWAKNDVLNFNTTETSASSIMEDGTSNINVVSLDYVLNGKRASFIKMDIEGSELSALQGARNTIINYRPRLAICIYHKPEDILEIPLYLQSLVPDYKFYIRHYSTYTIETVLYAV